MNTRFENEGGIGVMERIRERVNSSRIIRVMLIIAFGIFLAEPGSALGQWTTSGNDIFNSNTGNVGIGTTAPGTKLDIAGALRQKSSQPLFYMYDTAGTADARQFYFWNSNGVVLGRWVNDANSSVVAESISFSNNGNVGFGNAFPVFPVDVTRDQGFAHVGTTAYGPGVNAAFVGRYARGTKAAPSAVQANDPLAIFGGRGYGATGFSGSTRASISMIAAENWTDTAQGSYTAISTTPLGSATNAERVRIAPSGNVGIGTSAPGRILDVVSPGGEDGIRVTGAAVARLDLWSTNPNAGTRNWVLRPDTVVFGDFSILQSNARLGDPFPAGTSRLYIKNDGSIGVGTTAPMALLHVAGTARVTSDLTVDGNITSKYQDVAEWVPARHSLSAGTVVVIDSDHANQVIASSNAYDTRVAGVISSRPGLILGERGENKVMVATTGRVLVKVDATKSPIRVGDLLVTSEVEGVAMRSEPIDLSGTKIHRPGTIIGKALQALETGTGEILVLLSLQ
ncbi:MAG TPA: hypothetical protein VFV34_27260 [Blastocatellia bacterium]|nr:hypothetical protein [Blastocatellia bacterium]